MKKPSGTMGPFKISATSEGIVGEQIKILWPNNQKDIENKIFGYFKREFEKSGAVFLNVQDGGTKELDFLLTLPGGKTYLELMEVVVPKEGQIPHKSLDAYGCYPTDYANKVWEKVDKKIKKYGSQHTIAVDLLLYITHEQYMPGDAEIQILRHYFKKYKHHFYSVFFLIPLSDDFIRTYVIFDRDHPFNNLPPLEELEKQYRVVLPASGWKLGTQD